MRPLPAAICVAVVALLTSAYARADDDSAEVQFDYGLSEMMAGRYLTGCAALAGSFRLDPRPGTLFTLAECQRRWGHTASALASYDEYLAVASRMSPEQSAAQGDRVRIATDARWALENTVPRMAVRLPDGAPTDAIVERDDVVLSGPMQGALMPVDPGEHVIRMTLPDGRTSERREAIVDGEVRILSAPLPALIEASIAASPSAHPPSSHRPWTFIVLGAGAAGIAAAGIASGLALAEHSTSYADCSATGLCSSQAGVDAGNTAHGLANVATATFLLGAAGLVAAAVLEWTEPKAPRTRTIAWSPAGLGAQW
jgi:hypothetical protein